MRYFILAMLALALSFQAAAQHSYRVTVRDKDSRELLNGVTIQVKDNPAASTYTDANGFAILKNLKATSSILAYSFIGYKTFEQTIQLPDTIMHIVELEPDAAALHDVVVVASTRSNDRIENATTKVEVLGQEEMNEESTIKPGNIASILGDVSGIQIQQSSATSGNANIRIQGLDGRYTQLLKDGMPLYGGYSGGFGVLSVPPLDLKQVELIKGSSSTLYGGGAIGGLVNMISKKPSYTPDASFLVNQSTLKESNINAYYAQRWKKYGFTFFGGQTIQKAVDVNKDGFSDVPETNSTLIHPTLFFYPSSGTWFSVGWSGSFEKRTGGDMIAIDDKNNAQHPYYEKNKLNRNTFTLLSESRLNNTLTLSVKGSFSAFNRDETTNTYFFSGQQNNYYAEASVIQRAHKHNIIAGVNLTGDKFTPSAATPVPVGSFSNATVGIFAQDTWQLFTNTKLETGIRADHHNTYGNFFLPRIALFQRLNEHWGARAGFGMGYITPNPLTPQIRDYSIYQLQPIAPGVKPEKSYAGNAEINYKTSIGEEGSLFINQAFFITRINNPVVAEEETSGAVSFSNKNKPLITRGLDTYIQLHLPAWEFYLGYTYTDALRTYLSQQQFVPVTPRHRAAATALYEIEGKFRIGIEASYNSYQYREDYSKTPGYLFMAAMAEVKFGPKWSLVLNCENLFDERQSKYESLYTGPVTNPVFKTLWAPIDGRVANLCLRFQPFAR
ncbi:MAG: TonB-dependent receptor [Chitinophagaceae bacterium]